MSGKDIKKQGENKNELVKEAKQAKSIEAKKADDKVEEKDKVEKETEKKKKAKKKRGIFGKYKKEKKKEKKKGEEEEEEKERVVYLEIQPEYEIVDEYWIQEPFAKVKIAKLPELGGQKVYFVEEAQLTPSEKKAVDKLIDILSVELNPPEGFEEDIRKHVIDEARRLAEKYKKAIKGVTEENWDKILYYIERDLLGYGPIDVMMRDFRLEDISCDGVNRAIHVWHREHESIPTNVIFVDKEYLREFIIKLAHMAGKHISAAFPIVDAMLPGRHRLAATYGEEVSPRGSTFTIRKFREKPLSIINLLESGNLDEWTAAYLWFMLENRVTLMVIGATAAGKTTLLNSLTSFFKPGFKVVTIEETPELNLPHENWVQLVSRESYGLGEAKVGEITLFDLVKVSLRYRPDYIIVGEIRGEEAFVLFQAMSTGHGGMSTMHADSLDRAVKRLVSPPMNVSPAYIPSLNIVVLTERTILPTGEFSRRIRRIWEIEDYGRYREIVRWNPTTDKHEIINDSYLIPRLAEFQGKAPEDVLEEIRRRQVVLTWMKFTEIRDMKDVSKIILEYYVSPQEVYLRAVQDLERLGVKVEKIGPRVVAVAQASPRSSRESQVFIRESTKPVVRRVVEKPVEEKPVKIVSEEPKVEEEVKGPSLQDKILVTLLKLGGESDYVSLINLLNVRKNEFSSVVRDLIRAKMIVPVITYVENRPTLGYKLTAEGDRRARELSK